MPLIPTLSGETDDIDEAWKYFAWMKALDWKFLPAAGGLQDQDEMLINNIFLIHSAVRRMEKPEG